MFGRKLDKLKTIAVTNDEAYDIFTNYPIKFYIEIDNNIFIYLVHKNLDQYIIK
jgi:hypothetical protein